MKPAAPPVTNTLTDEWNSRPRTHTELRDRLVEHYRYRDPDKLNDIDDLVAKRISEHEMVKNLRLKYGVDPDAAQRQLPPLRALAVIPVQWIDDGEDKGEKEEDPGTAVPGGPLVTHLVINHLRATGRSDVVVAFVNESRLLSLPPRYYNEDTAPLPLESERSALHAVLFPSSDTRFHVAQLFADVRSKRLASFAGRQHSLRVGDALDALAMEPMWSDVAGATTRRRIYPRPDGVPVPRAAPINVFVECMTRAVIRPNVSTPESIERSLAEFVDRFLATHRHFIASPLLLAKLLQRFFVPPHLPLTPKYDANSIVIDDATSPSVERLTDEDTQAMQLRYLLQVTRIIQIKVVSVLHQWLATFPQHFDESMIVALGAFIDENCYIPASWSSCPSELSQVAEQIKLRIVQWAAADRVRPLEPLSDASAPRQAERGAVPLPLTARVSGAPVGRGGMDPTSQFLLVDEVVLSNQIAAADHALFRAIQPDEIYVFTLASSATLLNENAPVAAQNHAAPNLYRFVGRGEQLMNWAATEVLLAAPPPEGDRNVASVRALVVAKIINMIYRCIEINDLFAAWAFYAALRHPAVSRLRSTWALLSRDAMNSLDELKKILGFEKGYQSYNEYIRSIPDDDVYPPVPLIPITVDEVRRLGASEPTVLRDAVGTAVLHWRKFDVLGAIHLEVQKHQRQAVPLDFYVDPPFQAWLDNAMGASLSCADELVRASINAEPLVPPA